MESEFSDKEVEAKFRKGICYLCNGTSFISGPEAGLSQDVECEDCGVDLCVNQLSVTRVGWNMSGRFKDDGTLKKGEK